MEQATYGAATRRVLIMTLLLTLIILSSQGQGREITGVASWYGQKFAGRETASGERFDPNKLTIACHKIPLGSIVEITNLKNQKKTMARVTDRGPYVGKRKFDCSRAVADKLGFRGAGLTRVKVKVVQKPARRRS